VGVNAIHDFMKPLGFGQLTGIDIEGESRGILPSTDWKRRAYRKPEQQRWYDGETISLGIGQGYNSFTILQLAHATAILANNGVVMKPHLVKAVEDAMTRQRRLTVPKESYRLPFKQSDIDVIKRAMVGVTHSGTAARAFAGAAYESAGKTGTAQTYSLAKGEKYNHHALAEHKRDHALYHAFAPADKPKIALALIVENAGFGAQHAAPIARKIMDYYLLGKWPAELAEIAPPASERTHGLPPVDTPSVFTTGHTASIASASAMGNTLASEDAEDQPDGKDDSGKGGKGDKGSSAGEGSQGGASAVAAAPAIDPQAIAPASAPLTLGDRMRQALGHSRPPHDGAPPAPPSPSAPAAPGARQTRPTTPPAAPGPAPSPASRARQAAAAPGANATH